VESNVGIFGGTFDPPHNGHVAAALCAKRALGLERVLFVVANDPWQKSPERTISPADVRLELVARCVEHLDGLEVCDLEVARGGPSYTIDTVDELAAKEGIEDPWVIVGSDLAATLDTWERARELAERVRVAVLARPGSPLELPDGWRAVALESDDLDISSSQIRHLVATGQEISGLVPESVVHDIVAKGLYA
jgi:nicotinate-nucleotide adenylyltransferase